ARHRRDRDDLVAVVLEVGRRGDAELRLGRRHQVHRLLRHLAVGEALLAPVLAGHLREQLLQRARAHDRAREVVPAAGLGLLDPRHGHFAEALHRLRIVGQQLQQAVGTGQARGAAADDRHADLDQLVLGVEAALHELLDRVHRGREGRRSDLAAAGTAVAGHGQLAFLAFTASVSLGRILLRSPTMPRSENSKIGALASLLIATMFSEACIPTLCWIAPEIPAARYSFGATVLSVCPICAAYGSHPASATARVAATALLPPKALARSSANWKPSALPSPRPPAIRMLAPSMSTSAPSCSSGAAPAPVSLISNAFRRPMMIPTCERYLISEIAESPRIGRSAISSPPSARTAVTSMATPAPRRAARPAPISKPSRPPPNRA